MSSDAPARTLLSVAEVAQRLGVHEKTVRRLLRRGELPGLRVGGSVRVDERELSAWLYRDSA